MIHCVVYTRIQEQLYRNASSQYVYNKNNFPVPLQKLADKKSRKIQA